jgi:anti-anti-sigma factor
MALETTLGNDNSTTIRVKGRFDFSCHGAFRDAYMAAPNGSDYVVDLGGTSYIDSAALGMLLLLREHAQQQGVRVSLSNVTGQTKEVLQIANFHRLFKIQ